MTMVNYLLASGDSVDHLVVCDGQGKIIYCGVKIGEWLTLDPVAIVGEELAVLIGKQHLPEINGPQTQSIIELSNQQGEKYQFQLRVCPNPELELKELQLVEKKSNISVDWMLDSTFFKNPSLMAIISPRTEEIIEVSDSFLVQTGLSREQVVGEPLFKLGIWGDGPHVQNLRDLLWMEDKQQQVMVSMKAKKRPMLHGVCCVQNI